jgi:hypothetical protein
MAFELSSMPMCGARTTGSLRSVGSHPAQLSKSSDVVAEGCATSGAYRRAPRIAGNTLRLQGDSNPARSL